MQTIAISDIQFDPNGKIISKKNCQNTARLLAQKRILKVFLHTKYSIPSNNAQSLNSNAFLADYPREFTNDEYLDAEIDFAELMSKAYIVLVDFRSKTQCKIILRISGIDLPYQIKNTKSKYNPDI